MILEYDYAYMRVFLLLSCMAIGVFLQSAAAQNADVPARPFETVPGFYYFTDQGLYRQAAGTGAHAIFDEKLAPLGGLDFGNKLVFTFDDVVFDTYLDTLLELLAKYHIHAVFFLTASHMGSTDHATITKYLKRIIAEGHQLGNHSYSHDVLDRGRYAAGKDAQAATWEEFTSLEELVDRRLGYHYAMEYLRPPFGIRGNSGTTLGERMSLPGRIDEVCKELGRKLVLWHINSVDFLMAYDPKSREYRSSEQVIAETLKRIRASKGGIILFHANRRTPRVIEGVLSGLWGTASGAYQPATVADLLKMKYGTP